MDVPVIAGPELDALLAPGGDDVEPPLQGMGQLLDVEQIVPPLRRFLDVEQPRLQAVAGGVQGILQLAQGLAGLAQQLFAAVDGVDPVLGEQGRYLVLDLVLLLVHGALGEIDAPQGLLQGEGEARQHLGVPLLPGVGLERRLAGGIELGRQVFEQNGELDGVHLAALQEEVDDAHAKARQAIEAFARHHVGGEARQQLLANEIVDGVVGATGEGLVHLAEGVAHITEGVVQRGFRQIRFILGECLDRDQKGQPVGGEVQGQPLLSDPSHRLWQGTGCTHHDVIISLL